MKITTVRTLAGDCPVDNICPSIHTLDTHPERTYVVTKVEADPAIQAAFAHLVEAGQQLGWAPKRLFAGLDDWRDVLHDHPDHPDRDYLVTAVETAPGVAADFATLVGPGEQLGWHPSRRLTEAR